MKDQIRTSAVSDDGRPAGAHQESNDGNGKLLQSAYVFKLNGTDFIGIASALATTARRALHPRSSDNRLVNPFTREIRIPCLKTLLSLGMVSLLTKTALKR